MMATCTVKSCSLPHLARGFCNRHWLRWKRHGDPLAGGATPNPSGLCCSVRDCGRPSKSSKGYCILHYRRWKRGGSTKPKPRMNDGPCQVEGCPHPQIKQHLCGMHYARQHKRGSTNPTRQYIPGGFWAKVNRNGPIPEHRPELGPCWVWIGAKNGAAGYGRFTTTISQYAHHHLVGPPKIGMQWDHLCFNRACVRPQHLEMVTPSINIKRAIKHRRSSS